MLEKVKNIKQDYSLDSYSITLFFIVTLAFKYFYKVTIPLLVVVSLFQFYRLFTDKISKLYFFNTYLYLLVYSTVFHRSIQTIVLIVLLVFLVLQFVIEKPKTQLKYIKSEVLILTFFILIAVNLAIFKPFLKGLDKYLYVLFFPVVFLLLKKLSFTINKLKVIRVFITSILVASFVLLAFNLFDGNISLKTNTFFPKYLDLIHVYFGMFLAVAGCFLLILFNQKKNYVSTKIDIAILLLITLLIVHIGARMSLLSLLVIFVIFLFQKIPLHWLKKTALIAIIGTTFLIFSYNTIPRAKNDVEYIKKVFNSVKNEDKKDLVHNSWRNIYKRFLVTSYTLNQIKEKPLLGIGMQNVKESISKKIIDDGYLYFEPMNPHNQYLHILVGMGMFIFIYFLFMLFNFYKLQSYPLYFLTFFLIIMLTESLLVRVKGISLFFLFSLIFSFRENRN